MKSKFFIAFLFITFIAAGFYSKINRDLYLDKSKSNAIAPVEDSLIPENSSSTLKVKFSINPNAKKDSDGDHLYDDDEERIGKDPNKFDFETDGVDSDNDGLTDKEEDFFHTDPKNPDTDGDGLDDSAEVETGSILR